MLLAQADCRLGIAERLARMIPDGRDQDRVTHLLPDTGEFERAAVAGTEGQSTATREEAAAAAPRGTGRDTRSRERSG